MLQYPRFRPLRQGAWLTLSAVLRPLEQMATQRDGSRHHRACVYPGLGEQDAALDVLERALEERAGAIYGIKNAVLFASPHSRPRCAALLPKMNLA